MKTKWLHVGIGIALLLPFEGAPLSAGWAPEGAAVCSEPENQYGPAICSAGAKRSIITWYDDRNGDFDIYAQMIRNNGDMLWRADGVPICTETGDQQTVRIIPDGAGGAIITWQDGRSGGWDIYAQTIDANGMTRWTPGGTPVCADMTRSGSQVDPQLVSDGNGGAIITWDEEHIYVQRVDTDGNALWTVDGVPINTEHLWQRDPEIISDGLGGAIITWRHFNLLENGENYDYDVYAQRVDADGATMWTDGGIHVCYMIEKQTYPRIAPDGRGGAIIAWEDRRAVWPNADIYAQRIDPDGNKLWATDGVAVCTVGDRQMFPNIVSDDMGGAIIAWTDRRSNVDWDTYAQRIDASGNAVWTHNGIVVCNEPGETGTPSMCSPAPGEAVFVWSDKRGHDSDIYAQRIDADGNPRWQAGGRAVCVETGGQAGPSVTPDGGGGVIATWHDTRTGDSDIYARRLYLEEPIEAVLDIRPALRSNPFNPKRRGILPAALRGTEDLDVTDIDPASILLEGVAPVRWRYRDIPFRSTGTYNHGCAPARRDGFMDLLLIFKTRELAAALGEVSRGDRIILTLTGRLEDGTGLAASDFVIIRGIQNRPRSDTSGRITFTSDPTDPIQIMSIELPEHALLEVNIFDVAGRLVKRLGRSAAPAGVHTIEWNTAGIGSGVYFVQVKAANLRMTRKIVLIR